MKKTLLKYTAITAITLASMTSGAMAADIDVEASIDTQQAISLTNNADMVFGTVEYDAVHSGDIVLATGGTASLSGATGLVLSGTPNAGDVDIVGDGASVVEVSCETGATLTDGGANTLTIDVVTVAINGGGDVTCNGLGTSVGTVDLSVTANPTVLMGATIDTTTDGIDVSASYSTANAGGDAVTLRVIYQ